MTLGGVSLSLIDPAPVTSVAPYPGADPDPALSALGLRFPAPGDVSGQGAVRLAWAGREMAFLIGAPAPDGLDKQAALSDQSGGWGWVRLAWRGSRRWICASRACRLAGLRAHSLAICRR
mgnify:CR=1 FL=1